MRVGIVGSMYFAERMLEVQQELARRGHDAYVTSFAASFVGKSDAEKGKLKHHQQHHEDAIREFWQLMQGGDAILVLNLDRNGIKNYIGGNTLMEIGFAHVLGQRIFLYNPIPEMPFCKSELQAIKPVILSGDLALIK